MAKVCSEPGCPNLRPCETHKPAPWQKRNDSPRRLRGRAAQARNARVMRAHSGRCHVCGAPGSDQIDHVTPLAEGGRDDESNLAPIHRSPCHQAKTAAEAARGRRRH